MSNIEPTEEKKQAAREICSRFAFSLIPTDVEALARLLAEREAKLRDELTTAWARVEQQAAALRLHNEHRNMTDACSGEPTCWCDVHEIARLRARVAELEALEHAAATCAEQIDEIAELYRREAQHFADIKALRSAAADYVSLDYDDEHEDAKTDALVRLQRELKRLAHYDDAKAAEGGEG